MKMRKGKLFRPLMFEEFKQAFNEQLAIFKEGEEYSYVKDLKDAYKDSLKKPLD